MIRISGDDNLLIADNSMWEFPTAFTTPVLPSYINFMVKDSLCRAIEAE